MKGMDRVLALQCCRELQAILLHPPSSSPTKMFRDAMASASPLDEEFHDWKFCREVGYREEAMMESEGGQS